MIRRPASTRWRRMRFKSAPQQSQAWLYCRKELFFPLRFHFRDAAASQKFSLFAKTKRRYSGPRLERPPQHFENRFGRDLTASCYGLSVRC